MGKGVKIFLIIGASLLVVAVMIVGFIIGGLNKVVTMDENVHAAWAQVENQLQRRNDLIPNLVRTVKGYAAHEKEIFIQVADARSKLAGRIEMDEGIDTRIQAANELSSALSRLLMIVERYPDLKANQNFARLQDELAGTENRIAVERRRYNETVKLFNAHIRRIPGSFFAEMKGLSKAAYFDVPKEAQAVPKVDFS